MPNSFYIQERNLSATSPTDELLFKGTFVPKKHIRDICPPTCRYSIEISLGEIIPKSIHDSCGIAAQSLNLGIR
jgi:hypothetical protein